MHSNFIVMILSLGGCAGVYAEVAGSKLTSTTFAPSTGTDVDLGGATTLGFNLGVEFGSTRHRFALGYASDSVSFDGGSATHGASSTRYDFNVLSLAARMKLRIGLGFDFGSGGEATYSGMTRNDSGGGGATAGLDLTYFLTWKNAIHVFAGARVMSQSLPGGSMTGTGATGRVTISHTFGDARPDQKLMVPLDDNADVTGLIELGAIALGCVSTETYRSSSAAVLDVACPGGHHVQFFQISSGMMVTCMHEQSKSACEARAVSIIKARKKIVTPTPPAPPAPAPTPPAAQPTPVPPTDAAPPTAPAPPTP